MQYVIRQNQMAQNTIHPNTIQHSTAEGNVIQCMTMQYKLLSLRESRRGTWRLRGLDAWRLIWESNLIESNKAYSI